MEAHAPPRPGYERGGGASRGAAANGRREGRGLAGGTCGRARVRVGPPRAGRHRHRDRDRAPRHRDRAGHRDTGTGTEPGHRDTGTGTEPGHRDTGTEPGHRDTGTEPGTETPAPGQSRGTETPGQSRAPRHRHRDRDRAPRHRDRAGHRDTGTEPGTETPAPGQRPGTETPAPGQSRGTETPGQSRAPGQRPGTETPAPGQSRGTETPALGQSRGTETPGQSRAPRHRHRDRDRAPRHRDRAGHRDTGTEPGTETPAPGQRPGTETPAPGQSRGTETPGQSRAPGQRPGTETPAPGQSRGTETPALGQSRGTETPGQSRAPRHRHRDRAGAPRHRHRDRDRAPRHRQRQRDSGTGSGTDPGHRDTGTSTEPGHRDRARPPGQTAAPAPAQGHSLGTGTATSARPHRHLLRNRDTGTGNEDSDTSTAIPALGRGREQRHRQRGTGAGTGTPAPPQLQPGAGQRWSWRCLTAAWKWPSCCRDTRGTRTLGMSPGRPRAGLSGRSHAAKGERMVLDKWESGARRRRLRWLREELARKTLECRRLEEAAEGIRRRLRELVRLRQGRDAGEVEEDEEDDSACLELLARRLVEMRKRTRDEEREGEHGSAEAPALIPFLAWLGEECSKMKEAKSGAFSRRQELRREAEDSLRDGAVGRSAAAWEQLAAGLEQALEQQDQIHARMLQGSQILLEKLRREPAAASRCAVNGTEANPCGKSREKIPREGGRMEKELLELREGNGKLLVELARLGRERERLQQELRELRDPGKRDEAWRLRRELRALRDGVGARVREAGGDADAGILRDLHRRLDALVRSQHEALQLLTEMEGETGETPGSGGEGETPGEPGVAVGADTSQGPESGAAVVPPEPPGSEVERWREAAAAAEERAAGRERELRETAEGMERSLAALRERAARLERACRDKDGKLKQLLAETEKLSAEVLGLRGRSAWLQLQLEVQQKQHRDTVAVYRSHLLQAAQGFMDEGVHAALLRILRAEAGAGPWH